MIRNMSEFAIRHAEPADLPALTDLYNHYVSTTPISFDLAPFSLEQRRDWFDHYQTTGRHQLFVAVADAVDAGAPRPVGYASSSVFRTKAAYDTSVETSVYV